MGTDKDKLYGIIQNFDLDKDKLFEIMENEDLPTLTELEKDYLFEIMEDLDFGGMLAVDELMASDMFDLDQDSESSHVLSDMTNYRNLYMQLCLAVRIFE